MSAQGHIISKFNWHTRFDAKSKAVELQERLSYWSRTSMAGEIVDVFDRICPPDQTWKIQTLELDLGQVDYNDLETDLGLRLREQLLQKLIDLIVYMGRNSDNFEILNEDVSRINMLETFLTSGMMPWNYKSEYGTVNQMLTYQLQHHRQEIINLLRETGSGHENVRKRMAWQFNEPNIVKIIEGFEPNHYGQIIGFSNELTRIQTNEVIVQTSAKDFRKNLWHWIFNHLLTERGTIFNKVDFVKSSIRQMANHYNISYHELIRLIEEVVEHLPEYHTVKSDFIQALRVLSNDNRQSPEYTETLKKEDPYFWESLQMFFANHAARKRKDGRSTFNELVCGLSVQDSARFSKLVLSLPSTETYWLQVLGDLNDVAVGHIFHALSPAGAGAMQKSLQLLQEASRKSKIKTGRNEVLFTGIRFLKGNTNKIFDHRRFLRFCITQLNKKDPSFGKMIFEHFTGSDAWTVHENSKELYFDLTTALYQELSASDKNFAVQYLGSLLDDLKSDPAEKTVGHKGISIYNVIDHCIRLNPRHVFEALLQHGDKEKLRWLLPQLIGARMADEMVKSAQHPACATLLSIQRFCRKLSRSVKTIPVDLQDQILLQGIEAILIRPTVRPEAFMEEMLEKLFEWIQPVYHQDLLSFAGKYAKTSGSNNVLFTPELLRKVHGRYTTTSQLSLMEKIGGLLKSEHRQDQAARLLLENFREPGFVQARKTGKAKTILDYFVRGGYPLKEKLVQRYMRLLSPQLKNVAEQNLLQSLEDIFWKCILDYQQYKGNIGLLERSYNVAVLAQFQVHLQYLKNPDIDGDLRQKDQEEARVYYEELFFLIRKGITEGTNNVCHAGKTMPLKDLLLSGLERDPSAVRKIMASVPATGSRIENLREIIGFHHFSTWLFSDADHLMRQAMETLRQLSGLITCFDNGPVNDELHGFLFRQVWAMTRTGKKNAGTKEMVQHVLSVLQARSGITIKYLATGIRNRKIELNDELLGIFRQEIPGFLEYNPTIQNSSLNLARHERTGLLDELCFYLIKHQRFPNWYTRIGKEEPSELVTTLLKEYPARFLSVLKREHLSDSLIHRLHKNIGFKKLSEAITGMEPRRQPTLGIIEKFYSVFSQAGLTCIPAEEVRCILFEKLLRSWITGKEKLITVENIWNELVWEICGKRRAPQQVFVSEAGQMKYSFPPSLQVGLERLVQETREKRSPMKKAILPVVSLLRSIPKKTDPVQLKKSGIAVRNAGIVLINSYIPKLFQLLELFNGKTFSGHAAQQKAVHYLQYLVTGQCNTEESLLPLNKILCGLSVSEPVADGIDIPEAQKNLMDGLLKAAIGHWSGTGQTSLNGFRGNWLVRDGLLFEHEDKWELVVEKRAYDILINKSPFSFSIIRYPWMNKPLNVSWPY